MVRGDAVRLLRVALTAPQPCGSRSANAKLLKLTSLSVPARVRAYLAYVTSVATLARLNAAGLDG